MRGVLKAKPGFPWRSRRMRPPVAWVRVARTLTASRAAREATSGVEGFGRMDGDGLGSEPTGRRRKLAAGAASAGGGEQAAIAIECDGADRSLFMAAVMRDGVLAAAALQPGVA